MKHKQFTVTATVTFEEAITLTEARSILAGSKPQVFYAPWKTATFRGPFNPKPKPKKVKP